MQYNCTMGRDKALITLGERVKEIRIAKGLTQMELAHRIGKDHPSINKLENAKVNPSYLFLLEICEGLEIELKELI